MFKEIFENVRESAPLIHNITNYVTVNDVANMLIACGGAPIMADESKEVCEITSICTGLNINIGTLNERTIDSMLIAGNKANELGHPVVLDPVGVGASSLRTETAIKLIEEIQFDAIRGNISEIKTLALGSGRTKGVDADAADEINEGNMDSVIEMAKSFSKNTKAIITITGKVDIVTDGERVFKISNGHEKMSHVSGTGCQLSAVSCAFICANRDRKLESVAAAVSAMGLAGEIAYKRLGELDGNLSYRNYIIDAMYNLTPLALEEGAKYEII